MTKTPLLSMVLIARDEEDHIASCLASFWDDVDEVVLLDTGSGDATVQAAEAFAVERGERGKLTIEFYTWRRDFAHARQRADELASGKWLMWLDADERVHGLGKVRELLASVRVYARLRELDILSSFPGVSQPLARKIEKCARRITRAGATEWIGRICEERVKPGTRAISDVYCATVDPRICHITNRRYIDARGLDRVARPTSPTRDTAIALEWLSDEPENPRAVHHAISLLDVTGFSEQAESLAREFAESPRLRLTACYLMVAMALKRGDSRAAVSWAQRGLSAPKFAYPPTAHEELTEVVNSHRALPDHLVMLETVAGDAQRRLAELRAKSYERASLARSALTPAAGGRGDCAALAAYVADGQVQTSEQTDEGA